MRIKAGFLPTLYGSHVLSAAQRNYCVTRKELLAVVTFTRTYRHYLLGNRFSVRTDHGSLVWLMNFKNIEGQLARWLEELQEYDMEVLHRAGRAHLPCQEKWMRRSSVQIMWGEGVWRTYHVGVVSFASACRRSGDNFLTM